jgi:hypothetical protein
MMEALLTTPLKLDASLLNKDQFSAHDLLRQRPDYANSILETFGALLLHCTIMVPTDILARSLYGDNDIAEELDVFYDAEEE